MMIDKWISIRYIALGLYSRSDQLVIYDVYQLL